MDDRIFELPIKQVDTEQVAIIHIVFDDSQPAFTPMYRFESDVTSFNAPNSGGEKLINIISQKTLEGGGTAEVGYTHIISGDAADLVSIVDGSKVVVKANNATEDKSATVTFKQNESGKVISIKISIAKKYVSEYVFTCDKNSIRSSQSGATEIIKINSTKTLESGGIAPVSYTHTISGDASSLISVEGEKIIISPNDDTTEKRAEVIFTQAESGKVIKIPIVIDKKFVSQYVFNSSTSNINAGMDGVSESISITSTKTTESGGVVNVPYTHEITGDGAKYVTVSEGKIVVSANDTFSSQSATVTFTQSESNKVVTIVISLAAKVVDYSQLKLDHVYYTINGEQDNYEVNCAIRGTVFTEENGKRIIHDDAVTINGIVEESIPSGVTNVSINNAFVPDEITFPSQKGYTKAVRCSIGKFMTGYWEGRTIKLKLKVSSTKLPGLTEIVVTVAKQELGTSYGGVWITERSYINLTNFDSSNVSIHNITNGYFGRTYRVSQYKQATSTIGKSIILRCEFGSNTAVKVREERTSDNMTDYDSVLVELIRMDKWGHDYDIYNNGKLKKFVIPRDQKAHVNIMRPKFIATEIPMWMGGYWNATQLQELKDLLEANVVFDRTIYSNSEGWGFMQHISADGKFAYDVYKDVKSTSPTYNIENYIRNKEKDRA